VSCDPEKLSRTLAIHATDLYGDTSIAWENEFISGYSLSQTGRHPFPRLLRSDGYGERISDFRFAWVLGCRPDGGDHALQVPIIGEGKSIPSMDTTTRYDGCIGDMFAVTISKSFKQPAGGDGCDPQFPCNITQPCRPPWVGPVTM
jgi:hypothetical protein